VNAARGPSSPLPTTLAWTVTERLASSGESLHEVHQRIAAPATDKENVVNGVTSEHLVKRVGQ
jgi:hypothetical protein